MCQQWKYCYSNFLQPSSFLFPIGLVSELTLPCGLGIVLAMCHWRNHSTYSLHQFIGCADSCICHRSYSLCDLWSILRCSWAVWKSWGYELIASILSICMLWRFAYYLGRYIRLGFLTCLEILLQGMVAKLPAHFRCLERLSAKWELQTIDLPCLFFIRSMEMPFLFSS